MAMDSIISSPFGSEYMNDSDNIYRTYKMDINKKRITGMVDGIEAAQQSIFKAMQTRRFAHQIYDDQYCCAPLSLT